jgi:hypothetical protein
MASASLRRSSQSLSCITPVSHPKEPVIVSTSLVVVIPGLALPAQLLRDMSYGLSMPGLLTLLSQGRVSATAPTPLDNTHTLLHAASQPDTLRPAAALRRLGLGAAPDDAHWLCLDPIHLGISERGHALQAAQQLHITQAESDSLLADIAPMLAELGELSADTPHHWHLRLSHPSDKTASSNALPHAISAQPDLTLRLPRRWQQVLNDIQMHLHTHPINLARDHRGIPRINSLWPWGEGALEPISTDTRITTHTLYAHNPIVRGWAAHHGLHSKPPYDNFHDLDPGESSLIMIDDLKPFASTGDAQGWRLALQSLDARWLTPLAKQSPSPQRTIHLIFPARHTAAYLDLTPTRSDWLKRLFRRPRPATSLDALADNTTPP